MTFSKTKAYELSFKQLQNLLKTEDNWITKMSTINCVLKTNFPYYFWVGFYLVSEPQKLIVGPYQGTLGCLHIDFGKGVCGASAKTRETQLVEDVHAFPGHIACDSASNSEIVVPVFDPQKNLIAVFDVDSTEKASFNETDKIWLEKILVHFFERSEIRNLNF
ncbi:GAF domain-containing protein [bacterium]|nr:GAF domain-containing protein [bacterium]NCQ54825.1 GAF domain-containing protein [Candidatus Parcubacteria bacterium]NCS66869.1 GAF domain-containing protein [Candidatus Peregrinibacteria bacterium]NCS95815.1 GAF domain-containing protein [bacterium]